MIPLDHSIGSWNCRGEGQKLVGLGGLERITGLTLLFMRRQGCALLVVSDHKLMNRSRDKNWWVWVDSNHRPHPYQGCALTT